MESHGERVDRVWVPEPWLHVFACACLYDLGKSWLCSRLQTALSVLPSSIRPQVLEDVLKCLESSPVPTH